MPTTSKPAPAKDVQTSTSSVSSISPEISERAKWSRARKCYKRALKEEKAANTDSAAFYYDLSLQYFNAIDLGAIDVSMTHVLAVQRSVQESYDNFLAGLAELPAGTGAHSVLTEIAPPSEIPPGTTAVLVEEPELSPEEMRDTSVVIASHIQPISMLPPVPISHNNSVKQTIKFYQGRGRKVMLAWMERTAEVFPRIRPILREEGIPEEIMYLAMIESGLKYKAYSRSRASGLWQFIASTGRLYGLHIDRLYDERRHVEKETIAACRYLRKLYGDFGDWYLAMAAYNCGEGRVARHIKRHGTSNFWKLSHLPRQTRNYVPSYLAARIICENPEEYGFPPLPKEKPWDCRMVYVDGAYKLEDIAKAANASHDEVIRINPEFLHGATYSPHDSVMVRLPSHAKGDISAGLAAIPKAKLPDVIEHQVRRGETLSHIAQKYSSTVREILSMPQNARVKPRSMKPGQTIYVPISPQHLASNTQPRTTRTSTSAPDSRITYTVQKGQTLGGIARILGVSVHELCSWNSINDRNQIYPGQKLVVRVPSDMIASGEKTPLYHTVRRGDTVWDIANRYGRQTSDILRWNNLSKRSHIYPGQKLRVKPN
ncbi:LysM peptidoglycan-binding domain-containing protein [bacterium]|nr:LysM peptidoglycan-binding domain-containing protein [bacterium]